MIVKRMIPGAILVTSFPDRISLLPFCQGVSLLAVSGLLSHNVLLFECHTELMGILCLVNWPMQHDENSSDCKSQAQRVTLLSLGAVRSSSRQQGMCRWQWEMVIGQKTEQRRRQRVERRSEKRKGEGGRSNPFSSRERLRSFRAGLTQTK